MIVPSGSCRSNQTPKCLEQVVFSTQASQIRCQVGPTGYGIGAGPGRIRSAARRSRGTGTSRPGSGRNRANAARRHVPRLRRRCPRDGSPAGSSRCWPAWPPAAARACIPPPITTAGFGVRGTGRWRRRQRLGHGHLAQRLLGRSGSLTVQLHRRAIRNAALLGDHIDHHRTGGSICRGAARVTCTASQPVTAVQPARPTRRRGADRWCADRPHTARAIASSRLSSAAASWLNSWPSRRDSPLPSLSGDDVDVAAARAELDAPQRAAGRSDPPSFRSPPRLWPSTAAPTP